MNGQYCIFQALNTITNFSKNPDFKENIMRNTKLIRILSKLEKVQLRSFRDFIYSPYWNKNTKLQKLFDYLSKFHPEFAEDTFTEKEAYKAVFGAEKFKEKAILKLISKLYKLFEKFIITEESDLEGVTQRLRYLNFLGRNDLMKDYNLYLSSIQKGLEEDKMRDANYYYRKFLVEQESSLDFNSKISNETKVANILSAEKALDIFYIILKLNYSDNLHSFQITAPQIQFHSELIEELEQYVIRSPYREIPAIKIWYTALQLSKTNQADEYYFELKNLLFIHYKQLNKFDIHNIVVNLSNKCRLIFFDIGEYYKELFELHKFLFDTVLKNDPLLFSSTQYFNLISLAIWLEEYDWVAAFLEEHKDHGQHRDDDIYRLGLAMLAFAKDEFEAVHDHLLESRLKYFYFKLYERRLWLKLYTEKGMTDQIEHQVNSARKFISVNKNSIAEHHLEANRNFVNFVLQIHKLNPMDQESVRNLLFEIQDFSATLLPEKKWLESKVKNLLK